MSDDTLEPAFHQAMLDVYQRAAALKPPYKATLLLKMVNQLGGREAANRLLDTDETSYGFAELLLRGPEHLKLSVEYVVLQHPWRALFDDEQLTVARQRLQQVGCALPPENDEPAGGQTDSGLPDATSAGPPIRILPMSGTVEFQGQTVKQVQEEFFLAELPMRTPPGQYLFRTKSLNADSGTLVLFQKQASIIASATLLSVEWFDKPQGEYRGAMYFDVPSIRVFAPISVAQMQQVWPEFSGFSNALQSLDPSGRDGFENLLATTTSPAAIQPLSEEIPDRNELWEGARHKVSINIYERNPEARRQCIDHFGTVCQICHFDFEETFGPEAAGYIHVHHRVPLSKVDKSYRVSPTEDLIPVCPNCHAVLHLGGKNRTVDEVREMLRR